MLNDGKLMKSCFARLARGVMKQWEKDGKPPSVLMDPQVPSKGTWMEFWADVASLDQDTYQPIAKPTQVPDSLV